MWRSTPRSGKIVSTATSDDEQAPIFSRPSKPLPRGDSDRWAWKRYVVAIIFLLALFALSGILVQLGGRRVPASAGLADQHNKQATRTLAFTPHNDDLHLDDDESSAADANPQPENSSDSSDPDVVARSEVIVEESSADEDSTPAPPAGCDATSAKLRVYMYDLPPEFHYGMITEYAPAAGQIWPRNVTDIPRYPGGLYQQHSPEYWLTSDLLTSVMPDRRSPCTAFRVDRWEDADVVFVPFFASLSYNKYSRMAATTPAPSDQRHKSKKSSSSAEVVAPKDRNEELQLKLMAYLTSQAAWKASGGADHVIVIHHPNSMHAVRDRLRRAMFVVADFGRYDADVANITKDVVAPYKHVIPTFDETQNADAGVGATSSSSPYQRRPTLLFFQGAIVRKEGGIIRQQLHELLARQPGVVFATGNTASGGIKSATLGMRAARFCLHLAGDTPSSNRLFDAIASHCVPVVISDDIELPFEDDLDYADFCLFVNSTDALRKNFLLHLLQRRVSPDVWTRMWRKLQQVDRHFQYQHPTLPGDAVNMLWLAVARKVPALKLALHKRRRFARSTPMLPDDVHPSQQQ